MGLDHAAEDRALTSSDVGGSGMVRRIPTPSINLPHAELAYLAALTDTLQSLVQDNLVGVYLFGSAAYGEYEQGISDLDVQAVIAEALDEPTYRTLAASLQHTRLACPARRLEFVLYRRQAIYPATREPRFELNYNTGSGETDLLSLDPAHEASHWFLLDIALGRELGHSLLGPLPTEVFAPIPRRWQLEAMADSLSWHRVNEAISVNCVLNACRGWRYAVTGEHGSKRMGAFWAQQQPGCPPVVREAERRRQGGAPLAARSVMELTTIAMEAVARAIEQEPQAS